MASIIGKILLQVGEAYSQKRFHWILFSFVTTNGKKNLSNGPIELPVRFEGSRVNPMQTNTPFKQGKFPAATVIKAEVKDDGRMWSGKAEF